MSKILSLFESKAFDTGLLTTLAAAGAVFGFNVPVALILGILTPVMIGIGAQGWSDVVQVKAKTALQHEVKMHALNQGLITHQELLDGKPVPAPRVGTAQAGFVKLGLLIVIALMIPLLAVVTLGNSGCKSAQTCSDPKNASSAQCTIVNAIVDCTGIKSLDSVVAEATPKVLGLLAIARNADGSINWPAIESQLLQLAWQYGMCVIAQIWDTYFGQPPSAGSGVPPDAGVVIVDAGVGSGSSTPTTPNARPRLADPAAAHAEFNRIRARVAPGTGFKTKGGTL